MAPPQVQNLLTKRISPFAFEAVDQRPESVVAPAPGDDRNLPSALPAVTRWRDFSTGTLGLWGADHFVIYYRTGRVPPPGIVLLGEVTGDVLIFDRPGPVTVRVERPDQAVFSGPSAAGQPA